MTRLVRIAACSVLLAGPTVLAFFSGGFFDEPRLVAAFTAWVLVAAAALTSERPLPRSGPGRLALGGAAALTALTIASIAWAPLAGPALDDAQRALLYLGALVASAAFLSADRTIEPALAGGALLVVCYGTSERFLPGLVDLNESVTAGGRLEQPLTYWNAMGALAAMGLVVAARLAGDERRPVGLRAAAAAAAAPLGAGVYLTFSRGAIAALAAGLVVLAVTTPARVQLRAVALALATAVAAAVACGVPPWVRSLETDGPSRSLQGLLALAAVVAIAAIAAGLTARWARARSGAAPHAVPRMRLIGAAAAVALVGAVLLTAATEGRPEPTSPAAGARTERLRSLDSTRYDYWRVALDTFARHPLVGTGAAGFRVEWLRERDESDASRDAHSLYLETAAELGLAGLAALIAFLAGVGLCARNAFRADPAATAGLIALVTTWLVHAALDWDWEMPALTLVAIVAAGALVAAADRADVSPRAG
jgi:O-antigen ligase